MGKSSATPAAPDPKELARQQAIEDRRTQRLNLDATRTSTVNAYGRTGWSNSPTFDQAGFDSAMAEYNGNNSAILNSGGFAPANGYGAPSRDEYMHDNWTNIQTLSPESQGIYDTSTSKLQTAVNGMSTDPTNYNQSVADAVQRRMSRYLDPAMERQRNDLQTNLADRGFQVGNEAYKDEMTRMADSQSMAQADIADRAQITGASQGLNELSMQQQIARSLSDLRNQQVMGVSGMPTTTAAQQIQPFDISGATMSQWEDSVDAANSASGPMDTILPVAGAVVGGYFGGPAGAAAGASIGGAVAGSGKKGKSSKKSSFY